MIFVPKRNIWTPPPKWQRGSLLLAGAASLGSPFGLAVSPSAVNNDNLNFMTQCWAGVRFESSGVETGLNKDNVWDESRGNWLDSGDAADVWVERTINSGALNDIDPGAGRLQLSTTRSFSNTRVAAGTQPCNVTFDFWDAASGGNNIGSVTISIQSEHAV